MVPQNILNFLEALKVNNNRDWFNTNKGWYLQAKSEVNELALSLIDMVHELDDEVGPITIADCTFRQHRDTRFSKDKLPYKTHMGVFITRGRRKSPFAGYYLHIEPGNSLIAGGIYLPEPKVLNAVREEIFHYPMKFKAIIEAKPFVDAFGVVDGEKLKTAPKGFDKNWEYIDLLRYKSYNAMSMVSDATLTDNQFGSLIKNRFELMLPFNRFFNDVIVDLV